MLTWKSDQFLSTLVLGCVAEKRPEEIIHYDDDIINVQHENPDYVYHIAQILVHLSRVDQVRYDVYNLIKPCESGSV